MGLSPADSASLSCCPGAACVQSCLWERVSCHARLTASLCCARLQMEANDTIISGSFAGVFLMVGYMVSDSFTSNYQAGMFKT